MTKTAIVTGAAGGVSALPSSSLQEAETLDTPPKFQSSMC